MNEIRNNLISGALILPIIIVLPQIQHTAFVLLQMILFFVQRSFKSNLRLILDSITAESEKFYLEKMFDSFLALLPHHLLVFLIYFSRKEALIYMFFFGCLLMIAFIKMTDLIVTLNLIRSKEITKKDPFLERRLFFLTFLYICADTISLSFFALPLSFMISFATSVSGYRFFSLWLITSWQTDNGSVLFSNLLIQRSQVALISPKTTWEGISGGIFLRLKLCFISYILSVVTSFVISIYKEKSQYIPKMASFHFLMIALMVSVVSILGEFVNSFLKKNLNSKREPNIFIFTIGIIDRFSALVFSSPIVYFYAKVILNYSV